MGGDVPHGRGLRQGGGDRQHAAKFSKLPSKQKWATGNKEITLEKPRVDSVLPGIGSPRFGGIF